MVRLALVACLVLATGACVSGERSSFGPEARLGAIPWDSWRLITSPIASTLMILPR